MRLLPGMGAEFVFALVSLAVVAATPSAGNAMSVSLAPSAPSPAPLGTVVTWTANISDADPGVLWYRFRAHRTDQPFHVVRDYGPVSTLDWTSVDREGSYEVELSVRNLATGETATVLAPYVLQSLVTGDSAVITPTSHPLVFLYSAPPCAAGSRARVQIQSAANVVLRTPYKRCAEGVSVNFLLAVDCTPNQPYLFSPVFYRYWLRRSSWGR